MARMGSRIACARLIDQCCSRPMIMKIQCQDESSLLLCQGRRQHNFGVIIDSGTSKFKLAQLLYYELIMYKLITTLRKVPVQLSDWGRGHHHAKAKAIGLLRSRPWPSLDLQGQGHDLLFLSRPLQSHAQ